ncbi:metal-sensitive transcriptional regulator [Candidatus Kaiserbacteria bacterium]|nr:metal-sensitive transcriptional regulator [Candidatus Kaiserbacteria bacterium]
MQKTTKKKVVDRLRRIAGQVRGLEGMVGSDAYYIDIITQAQAVKSALSSVESIMLKNHLETHVIAQVKSGKEKKAVEEILKVYKLAQKKK